MAKRLGKNQEAVLKALHNHGSWSPGCGWIWGTRSDTIKIMESLVKHGLVTAADEERRGFYPGAAPYRERVYRVKS